MTDHIHVIDADGVREIVFARPEKRNAITHAMYTKIVEAMHEADVRPDVRVILFRAEGSFFTAGNDMADFLGSPPQLGASDMPPVERFLRALLNGTTPLIAAIDGGAVGIGLTMLLHCDLVYAGQNATFKAPFVDLALVPEAGSSLLLPALIGRARAAEILLLGASLSAREALDVGFVTRLIEGDVLAHARDAARALAAKAPRAVRETRRLMRGDLDLVGARMTEEGRLFSAHLQSEEFHEAATAFLEKRAADFSRFL